MTDKLQAAAQAALEALERARAYVYETDRPQVDASMDALRAALAETEVKQKPVFWYRPRSDDGYEGPIHHLAIEQARKLSSTWIPLYTAPPRREWVSLTEQEIWDSVKHGVVGGIGMPSKAVAVARAIEAALKERNT